MVEPDERKSASREPENTDRNQALAKQRPKCSLSEIFHKLPSAPPYHGTLRHSTRGPFKPGVGLSGDPSAVLRIAFPQAAEELINVEGQALPLSVSDPFHRNRRHRSEDSI